MHEYLSYQTLTFDWKRKHDFSDQAESPLCNERWQFHNPCPKMRCSRAYGTHEMKNGRLID
jgi:hypothetical protein